MKTKGFIRAVRMLLLLVLISPCLLEAQTPEWIWHDNKGVAPADDEIRFFRKSFTVGGPINRAMLTVAGDDQATVYLNGKRVALNRGWNKPTTVNVTQEIKTGVNLFAVRGNNQSGEAAIIAKLELTLPNNPKQIIVTDATWLS